MGGPHRRRSDALGRYAREYLIRGESMNEFKQYRRKQIVELRPYVPGEILQRVSISEVDELAGSPKLGDMIARNPKNHDDVWLVTAQYFADNFEEVNKTIILEGGL
jgi:hypothetical protein